MWLGESMGGSFSKEACWKAKVSLVSQTIHGTGIFTQILASFYWTCRFLGTKHSWIVWRNIILRTTPKPRQYRHTKNFMAGQPTPLPPDVSPSEISETLLKTTGSVLSRESWSHNRRKNIFSFRFRTFFSRHVGWKTSTFYVRRFSNFCPVGFRLGNSTAFGKFFFFQTICDLEIGKA